MIAALAPFHFERPLWLLALIPAAALWLLTHRSADMLVRWRRVIDPALLPHLVDGETRPAIASPVNALALAWLLVTIAVAGPAWQREPSPFAQAKPPVAIVLKVTPSMLTQDLAPTRLDRARQKLADTLAAREGAAASLIAYSGSSHLVLPPTPDSAVVLDLAKSLSPEIMPREGDDLAGALVLARRVLSGMDDAGSVLIMADAATPQAMAGHSGGGSAVTILSLLAPGSEAGGLPEIAKALDATLIETTVDQADVTEIVRRLDRADQLGSVAGEGQHWREAGYWLTPLIALLALLWFRRGWVLP
ncbi:MAG TPA: VWA domain-containing protein [Bosea sp. (in: a-proteobacteria)]|uniref:VWA domain-containing protein n=1 Tax=Bosea sp. (in: a-proteobacteria) TaxID=1871050 RepID=UPI002E12A52D|nr:VWA domain-containing protein [Bosea sp. (in: a-proteobacteria)]